MKTFKFWTLDATADSWVKIKIRAGQTLRHENFYRHSEGWTLEARVWHYDGERLTLEAVYDGTDCDGRLTRGSEMEATALRPYQETRWNPETYLYEPFGPTYLVPDYQELGSSQRDYSAESMGY